MVVAGGVDEVVVVVFVEDIEAAGVDDVVVVVFVEDIEVGVGLLTAVAVADPTQALKLYRAGVRLKV